MPNSQVSPLEMEQVLELTHLLGIGVSKSESTKEAVQEWIRQPKRTRMAVTEMLKIGPVEAARRLCYELPLEPVPVWMRIEIGIYRSVDAFQHAIKERGNGSLWRVNDEAEDMIRGMKIVRRRKHVNLIKVTPSQLGFPDGGPREQVYASALARGWRLCPPEVGPILLLSYYQDQPHREDLVIAMDPIWTWTPKKGYSTFHIYKSYDRSDLCGDDSQNVSPREVLLFCEGR